MADKPTPVIICSSLAEKGAELSLQALAAGAIDIITKPQLGVKDFLMEAKHLLWQTVRAAAGAHLSRRYSKVEVMQPKTAPMADLVSMATTTDSIIVIGTSTGGTQALEQILCKIPRTCPGIAVVQHMPEKFTAAFAARLNGLCEVDVKEAETGDR
jgi:two-component system chemotaxis response regulator CheB